MSAKVLEYIIKAKDATTGAVKSATAGIKSFASSVATNLANVKAGFDMAKGVALSFASVFKTAISEAFKFEKAHSDFTGLLNSVDAAKAHIADLREFAASTPLTFDDLSKASKLLLSFGTDVNDVMPAMKMLGDIAMGDKEKFQGLALVFAQVKSAGKLMGQDLLQMINQGFNPLTVIAQKTGKSMSDLKDLMAEGGISFEMVAEAMRIATTDGGLFNNAMSNAAKTGQGLMSTLQDKWTDIVRTFGDAFADSAKGGVQTLIDKCTDLIQSGTVDVWAGRVASALEGLTHTAQKCGWAIDKIVKAYSAIRSFSAAIGATTGSFFGTLFTGGSLGDASSAASSSWSSTINETTETEAAIRSAAVRKHAATSGPASVARTVQSAKSLTKMLADAEVKERIKVEEKIAKHRNDLQKRTLSEYESGLRSANDAASKAQAKYAAAQSKTDSLLAFMSEDDPVAAYTASKANTREARYQKYLDYKSRLTAGFADAGLNAITGRSVRPETFDYLSSVEKALAEERDAADYARETAEKAADAVTQLEKLNHLLENGRAE